MIKPYYSQEENALDIAVRILQLCNIYGVNPHRLATIADVPSSTLQNILSGSTSTTTVATIEKLCGGLGITMADFFADEEPPADIPPDVWQAMKTISDYVKKTDPGK